MTAEDRILENLRRSERRYHLFKAALIVACAIVIVAVNIALSRHIYENSDKNRRLLRCTVVSLVDPTQTPDKFRSQLNNCLDKTK